MTEFINVTNTHEEPYVIEINVPINTTLYRNVSNIVTEPYTILIDVPTNTTLYRNVTTSNNIPVNSSCGAAQAPNKFTMSLTTLSKNIDNGGDEVLLWDVYKTSDSKITIGNLQGVTTRSENNVRTGTTKYGTFVTFDTENTPADLSFNYPSEQALGQVFVTGNKDIKRTNSTSGGSYTTTSMTRLEVGKSVLDSNINDISGQNMIVVGGPCVNSVAKVLMGNKENCAEGFVPGEGILKLVQTGNKVAMIVAGYSAEDTIRTSRFIAKYELQSNVKGTDLIVDSLGNARSSIPVTNVTQ
jgi:hypothetical protein